MILLIHLLQHLGVPTGAAIAIVIAAKKLLKGVTARLGHGHNDHDASRRHPRDYR
jgi:hypothetical protein